MRAVGYRYFSSGFFKGVDTVCRDAAAFATELGPERLISMSTAHSSYSWIVTIWYWE